MIPTITILGLVIDVSLQEAVEELKETIEALERAEVTTDILIVYLLICGVPE